MFHVEQVGKGRIVLINFLKFDANFGFSAFPTTLTWRLEINLFKQHNRRLLSYY